MKLGISIALPIDDQCPPHRPKDQLMKMDPQQQPRWWEKTVEYAFVLQCLPEAAAIAPLSGAAEQGVGDATLRIHEGYLLIEFKARRDAMIDELKKYERALPSNAKHAHLERRARLDASLATLRALPQSDAHQLVFGDLDNGHLRPAHVRYTDALNSTAKAHWLDRATVQALPRRKHAEMIDYLAQLRALRGVDSETSGTVVVGVSLDGCSMMTIEEFERNEPSLQLSIAHTQSLAAEAAIQHGVEITSRERAARSRGFSR